MRLAAIALLLCAVYANADNVTPASGTDTAATVADLLARSQYEQAHETALAWSESAPDSPQASYWVGRTAGQLAMRSGMFKAMGLAKTSRRGFEAAIERDPGYTDAQFALMQYYMMAPGMMGGDEDEAKAIAARLAQADPIAGHKARAFMLARAKDTPGYLREYQAVLAVRPADTDAVGVIVGSFLSEQKIPEAKAVLDAALALKPGDPLLRYQYAKWSAMSGMELEQGLSTLDELIALSTYPNSFSLAGAHFRRAQILKQLGRKPDAIAALEQSLAVEPESKQIQEELERLRENS